MISWDGIGEHLPCILVDAKPDFDILIIDYSGKSKDNPKFNAKGLPASLLSRVTQCKGDLFQVVGDYLEENSLLPEYIGMLDDDIVISIADINKALHLAKIKKLDIFSPVLTHDSEFSHRWMLQQPHRAIREVDWVEVMMPFYRAEIFMAARPFFQGFVTSWGFDKYLFPMIQKILEKPHCGLIDIVSASHFRPVTSQLKVYRNGLTAAQEMQNMKKLCIDYIKCNHADLIKTEWFDKFYTRKNIQTRMQKNLYRLGRPIKQWLERSA
jgi:hypothetical protein